MQQSRDATFERSKKGAPPPAFTPPPPPPPARQAARAPCAANRKLTDAERTLTAAVEEVNSFAGEGPANNPNIKFRSFVCCGLNNGLLHEWVVVLTTDEETMNKFYETWAFVRASENALPQMTNTLRPLSNHKYTLSLDYEISRWDLH